MDSCTVEYRESEGSFDCDDESPDGGDGGDGGGCCRHLNAAADDDDDRDRREDRCDGLRRESWHRIEFDKSLISTIITLDIC